VHIIAVPRIDPFRFHLTAEKEGLRLEFLWSQTFHEQKARGVIDRTAIHCSRPSFQQLASYTAWAFIELLPCWNSMASILVNYWKSLWESLLSSLGLGGGKEGTLLLLGLDNAGKTTLLHRIRTGDIKHFPPTDRPYQSDKFSYQGLTFQAWDLGGQTDFFGVFFYVMRVCLCGGNCTISLTQRDFGWTPLFAFLCNHVLP